MNIEVGKKYILDVKRKKDYTMDGCNNGDIVTVKAFDVDEHDSVWIDVTRSDGSICTNFIAFKTDLKEMG
jgi:hypothetical protein